MPLIDVTYDPALPDQALRRLAEALPDVVAEAVACPEEPWVGPPQSGDVEIRFRPKGPFDVGELGCVVEVRTKRFASRLADTQERAERIRAAVAGAVPEVGLLGVWLILHEGAWAQ